ncbi:MAG: Rab family GTPase [Candidatus Helarchaeota archaeon]
MAANKQYVFKIVVIGNGAVGKTSLIARFAEKMFKAEYKPTLGVNIVIKEFDLDKNHIKLTVWDIAGQARWRDVRSVYYKGANGSIIVFDVTRPGTFEAIPSWYNDLVKFSEDPEIPRILLANKIDLQDLRKVPESEGQKMAKELNAPYFETSAKDGTKVDEAFKEISNLILKRFKQL